MPAKAKGPRVSDLIWIAERQKWRFIVYGLDRTDGKKLGRRAFEYPSQEVAMAERVKAESALKRKLERSMYEAIEAFMQDRRENDAAAESLTGYEKRFALIFPPEPLSDVPRWRGRRQTPLGTMDRDLLTELYASARRRKRKDTGALYAVATHRKALVNAKTLFRFCGENRWLKETTVDSLCKVQGKGKIRKGKKQLTLDELRLFVRAAWRLILDPRPGRLVIRRRFRATAALIALLQSIRSGAIRRLKVRHIDDNCTILITPRIKTDTSEGRQELAEPLRKVMWYLTANRDAEEWLWESRPAKHWVLRSVKEICRIAGVPVVTPHGLRGSHSSVTTAAGALANLVVQQLGQASFDVTREHYITKEAQATGKVVQITRALWGDRADAQPGEDFSKLFPEPMRAGGNNGK